MSSVPRTLIAWGSALFIAACHSDSASTPSWHQERGYRWRELRTTSGQPDGFSRMDRTGIKFQNDVADEILVGNRMLAQGAGIALGDVDGDGGPDIFLAKTQGCSALYRNTGDWQFEDITKTAGVGACERHSSGAAFADVDGDGDLDLILLATTGPNSVFFNDGRAHFTEHGADSGIDTTGRGGTTITMSDVDGNGTLDLFVANYKPYSPVDTIPPQQRAPNQIVRQVGPGKFEVIPQFARDFKIVNRPDMGGMNLSMLGEPNDFYLNTGSGRFLRVPMASERFRDSQGAPMTLEGESFTLNAKFADVNGDGAPDLYIANDFEDTDQLWLNDGKGNFRLANWQSQRQTSNSAMGMDVADVNGDGLPDLFEVDMLSNESHRLKTQMPTHTALPKRPGDLETGLQQQRNTLFINRGDGTFTETGMLAGVQASGWSWGTIFNDVDLDGRPDILIATGHAWDLMDADTQERLQNRLTGVSWQKERWEYPSLKLKNVAFRNKGDVTFEDVSEKWGFGTEDDISHTLAAADLDGDGDLDVVVNRFRSPALILRNNASAPRVGVRLVGDAPNTQAVGARVRLVGGAVPTQQHEVQVGGIYMSHSDYQMAFGMGKADSATLVVDWRDGRRTTLRGVKPNRLYEIGIATATERWSADTNAAQPALFEDATAELRGHAHADPAFDDWERQFLLPNSFSQLGPGVTWFDFDRDGYEDLIVGAGRGSRLGVFRNDRGRLVAQTGPAAGPFALEDFTTILGIPNATGSEVLIGVANWEGQSAPAVLRAGAGRNGITPASTQAVPNLPASVGATALADYDGDGDLDLFVGGRVVAGKYPESAPSYFYRNDGGRFVIDTANTRAVGSSLVSAATFADIDGDGRPDLLLAREWDSLLLLLNRGGQFSPAPESWGLSRSTSRWNGVAVGDLDGDGRLDIVATSWGRNTITRADSTRPLVMFYGPFGSNGEVEMLIGREDQRLHSIAPLNSYPRARIALRDLSTRVGTFAAYADATMERVLGPAFAKAQRKSVASLDHMVFMNRGDHFESMPLPLEAQFSPAFYAGIADFDGDGAEDLFLSQNFFPTAVGIPRYDNGRALLMRNDGKGGLQPMSGAQSGIVVYGDQRGAAYADADHDGRLDLVVSQNAAPTRFFHNRSAKPGLRVRVQGPPGNADGVGTQLRVVYGDRMGPLREVQAGSGYWSQNGAVQVFGLAAIPTAVWVRWPGGAKTRVDVPANAREVTVTAK